MNIQLYKYAVAVQKVKKVQRSTGIYANAMNSHKIYT